MCHFYNQQKINITMKAQKNESSLKTSQHWLII